jgi:hypothetical protein
MPDGERLARIVAFTACAIAALGQHDASAEPSRRAHAVIVVEGAKADATNDAIEHALQSTVVMGDGTAFVTELKAEGQALTTMPPSSQALRAVRTVGTHQGVEVIILVRTVVTARGRLVSCEALDAQRGSLFPVHSVRLPRKPSADDAAKFDELVADVVTLVPPPPEVQVVIAPPPQAGPAPPPPPPPPPPPVIIVPGEDVAHARIIVEADFDGGGRNFGYHDGLTKNLRSYSVGFVPQVAGWVEAYPFAFIDPALADLGVAFDIRDAVSLTSTSPQTGSVHTDWIRFDAGLRYRARFGRPLHPFLLGLSAQYARESFAFSPEGPSYPAAIYSCMHLAADLRFPIGASGVTIGGAYLPVLSSSGVETNFRGNSAEGVELTGGVSIHLVRSVNLELRGIYTRFFMSFHPIPGDGFVAGGALDQLFHGEVGVRAFY